MSTVRRVHLLGPPRSEGRRRGASRGSLGHPAIGSEPGERPSFWIETFGCEMNDYDSEFIASRLLEEGFAPAPCPETADVLLFNTCAVRQGAEERVRARLEGLSGLKKERPGMILGVVGCMAQRLGEELDAGDGLVDLVAGTGTYRELPSLIEQRRALPAGAKLVCTDLPQRGTYGIGRLARGREGPCAFLTIMEGCNKFCTFCVVPYTRGRERSKPWREVVREARQLVERGAKQITLLGQNVSAYRDGDVGFAELLRRVDGVEGLERLGFTSSYPREVSAEVFRAMAECRTVVEFLHFPVQSGSDRILRRMKRRHTVEWYLRRIDEARRIVPDIQFSTDLIVGFPGETGEDFRATLRLVERVRFAECFMYKYSPRPGTPALRLSDGVPEEEKSRRLEELIALQRRIGEEILRENLGRVMEVLVEGPSRRNPREPFGRTRNRFMVVLPEDAARPGELRYVLLGDLKGSTYRGVPVNGGKT